MTQIVRKEISRKVSGTLETVVNLYHKVDIITTIEINELQEAFDDYDVACASGLGIDCNDELIFVDVDALLDALDGYIDNCHAKEKDTCRYSIFKTLSDKLGRWKAHTIWI